MRTVNPAELIVIACAANCKVCNLLVRYAIWAPSISGGFHLGSSARKEMVTTYKRTGRHVCLDRVENNKVDLLRYDTLLFHHGCTRWRSWLRLCATSRKVGVHFPIGSLALGSTQSLTEFSISCKGGGVKAAGA